MNFKQFFYTICEKKQFVVQLNRRQLATFKKQFYSSGFKEWQLNLIWLYFWNDKSYDEIVAIFKNKKLL